MRLWTAAALTTAFAALVAITAAAPPSPAFRDPDLPVDRHVGDLLSRMTVDEKIDALGTDTAVPRLAVPSFGSSEGIHGLQQRGAPEKGRAPITTTQFPQPPGMARPGPGAGPRGGGVAARIAYRDAGRGAMTVEPETVRLSVGTSAAEMKGRVDLRGD